MEIFRVEIHYKLLLAGATLGLKLTGESALLVRHVKILLSNAVGNVFSYQQSHVSILLILYILHDL